MSPIDICNLALSHLGDDANLQSFEDGSQQAAHASRFYDMARKSALEAGAWSFATVRATGLTPAAGENESGWLQRYALPSDCLKPTKLLAPGQFDEREGIPFEVRERVLYTNYELPTLIYVKDVVDTTKFTGLFTDALSFMLASYLAGPILKKADAGRPYRERAQAVAAQAAAADANATSQQSVDRPAPWMTARGVDIASPFNR